MDAAQAMNAVLATGAVPAVEFVASMLEGGDMVEYPAPKSGASGPAGKVAEVAPRRKVPADVELLMHLNMTAEMARVEFRDVRFICVGGTDSRMKGMADALGERLGCEARELSRGRFAVFKVGKVLLANHGMGCPSVSICMNELVLGLRLAGNEEAVRIFRVGTTGGVGVPAGTVVVTTESLNELLQPAYEVIYMGERRSYATFVDPEVVAELGAFENVEMGKTMTANCFYDNQGRVDGPFAEHTVEDKFAFLRRLQAAGVRNIEMEGTCFSALARRAGLRPAIVCMVVVNRLEGEIPPASEPRNAAIDIVCQYIARHHAGA